MSIAFVGLGIILFITGLNVLLCRKKTIPVMACDQIAFSIAAYLISGPITIVYFIVCVALLVFCKYRAHISDNPDFDYSDRIYSISSILNKTKKAYGIVVGTILPVNHREIQYNQRKLALDNTILSGAVLLTGASGSGKSSTLKSILKQRIDERGQVVFVDYKGEEEILDFFKNCAKSAGIPYYEFSARDCTFTYDPFANLNETGKVEALLNTRRWSLDGADEHYKTSMQLAIQNMVHSYDQYREEHGETVNYIVGLYNYAESYKPQLNEKDGFNNLIKSLEILLSSRAKDLFGNDPTFSFEEDRPYVLCFSFTSANKQLANNISSFVYTNLMDRGTRNPYPKKLLLGIDEFGTLENSMVIKDLLEKGRSGGVQTVFSVLDINQIAMTSGEYFVQAILGTINNFIIHAGATQNTADMLAGVQKYDKGYDIMNLRKPYKGKKPTALFISKYPIISTKNNQEVYRIVPYAPMVGNPLQSIPSQSYTPVTAEPKEPELSEEMKELTDFSEPISIDEFLKHL